MLVKVTTILLVALWPVAAQDGELLPTELLNRARIQHRMVDQLNRLPNYTCLETIDRYSIAPGAKPKAIDRIRINVALVDGKELYGWPGAKRFEDRTLGEMLKNGFISDGDFSTMARNVFVHRNAAITFAGEETVDGRKLLRYNFDISAMRSGWRVQLGRASGVVGARGWFYADPVTYNLVKFSFEAVDLPPFSPEKTLSETADYAPVHLGSTDILLPLSVDLESEAFDGVRHWNHLTFSTCREYVAQSTISFGDENSPAPAAVAAPVSAENNASLPPGLEVALRVDAAIDSVHTSVGDEIRAVVSKDVRIDREIILPRGTAVKGQIRRLDRHVGNRPYYTVAIEFTEAVSAGKTYVFFGRKDSIGKFPGLQRRIIGIGTPADRTDPGVGIFYVEGEQFVIPQGLAFTWITESVRSR